MLLFRDFPFERIFALRSALQLFRPIIGLNRFGLNDARGVTFLPVLGLRRDRPRHVAAL